MTEVADVIFYDDEAMWGSTPRMLMDNADYHIEGSDLLWKVSIHEQIHPHTLARYFRAFMNYSDPLSDRFSCDTTNYYDTLDALFTAIAETCHEVEQWFNRVRPTTAETEG